MDSRRETMARVKALEPQEADGSCRELFDDFIRERGAVPNMFRTLAHAPEMLKTVFAHFRSVMANGAVETRVKEMIAVRVSHLNRSRY